MLKASRIRDRQLSVGSEGIPANTRCAAEAPHSGVMRLTRSSDALDGSLVY